MDQQIEYVARAFYDAEGEGQSWDNEPDILQDEFRIFARSAIALVDQGADEALSGTGSIEFADAA